MSNEPKFEVTNISCYWEGMTFYRIRALKSFSDVKKGDYGGLVETEAALSQEGDCWIYDNAKVRDSVGSWVSGNAKVKGNCFLNGGVIYGEAEVSEEVTLLTGAKVSGNVRISGCSQVCQIVADNVQISGVSRFTSSGSGEFTENCVIEMLHGSDQDINSVITGNVVIKDVAHIYGCKLFGNAEISGKSDVTQSTVFGDAKIYEEAQVNACIIGSAAKIHGSANISSQTLVNDEEVV